MSGVEMEGLAIDQVNIYDRAQIYDGSPMQWTLPVSGKTGFILNKEVSVY
jgi:hypothetical protein